MKGLSFLKLKIGLLAAVLIACGWAQANDKAGNGGNAIVCYADATKNKIVSIEMFDYWEMSRVLDWPEKLDLGSPKLPVSDKIRIALNRLNRMEPAKAERIRTAALRISEHIDDYLVSGVTLADIDDDTPRTEPKSPCFKEQFAVQALNPLPGTQRFRISRELYGNPVTSNDTRAGIILHEAIYRDAIQNGHTTSDASRYFNYLISTPHIDGLSPSEYVDLTRELKLLYGKCMPKWLGGMNVIYIEENDRPGLQEESCLHDFDYHGADLRLHIRNPYRNQWIERYPNGTVKTITVNYDLSKADIWLRYDGGAILESAQPLDVLELDFDQEFRLRSMRFLGKLKGDRPEIGIARPAVSCVLEASVGSPDTMYFTPDRGLKGCVASASAVAKVGGREVSVGGGPVLFDDRGFLRSASLASPAKLPIAGIRGRLFNLKSDRRFNEVTTFNEKGEAISGDFQTPIEVTANGIPGRAWSFTDAEDGTVLAEVISVVTRVQGHRIGYLSPSDSPNGAWEPALGLCAKFGFHAVNGTDGRNEEYIGAPEAFYFPVEDRVRTLADERVRVLTKVACHDQIRLKL